MTSREKEDEFSTKRTASEQVGPNEGDLVTFTHGHEFQLSNLEVELDSTDTVDVVVRNSAASTSTIAYTRKTDYFEKGDFVDPVVEAGADEEIAVRNTISANSGATYIVNARVDKLQG